MSGNVAETGGVGETLECRPFVKWVGGKSQLLSELLQRIPSDYDRYFEPFVGGGALLFSHQPKHGIISDLNPELINAYQVIQGSVEELISDLQQHCYESQYFYRLRNFDRLEEYKSWSPIQRASRFIYLNKSCYNGLYRVNSKGQFNTPFGRYTDPTIVDPENLRACSALLKRTEISLAEFAWIEAGISAKDFVYFDPPYVPLSPTANFTGYHNRGFDQNMQQQLYDLCVRLDKRGVRFMLSNSSAPIVLDMYSSFKIARVEATRAINSKASKRGPVHEVIVTNY